MRSFAENLDLYARVAVKVGVNLQPGQRVYVRASIQAADLVRRLVREAYAAGAYAVHVDWSDEQVSLIRYQMASDAALVDVPQWLVQQHETLANQRAAHITVLSPTPDLFKDIDPQRLANALRAQQAALHKASMDRVTKTSWLGIAAASPAWAAQVYPLEDPQSGLPKLWDDVFSLCRIDQADPIEAWRQHVQDLARRAQSLNQISYRRLHFEAPGTDLTVDLPKGHRWISGKSKNEAGTDYVPNIPTEETFTLPKRDGVNGTVRATLPLNYNGVMIENIRLELRDGIIVQYEADSGYEALRSIIESDDGSRRLGEVALVSQDSPIARLGRLFYNTLYDENASCHLAIGAAYQFSLEGGLAMSDEEFVAAGGNQSLTHVDFMIGSEALDVTAEDWDGKKVPLLRQGRWTF